MHESPGKQLCVSQMKDSKVTIPEQILEKWNLKPGDIVSFFIEDGEVKLKAATAPFRANDRFTE